MGTEMAANPAGHRLKRTMRATFRAMQALGPSARMTTSMRERVLA